MLKNKKKGFTLGTNGGFTVKATVGDKAYYAGHADGSSKVEVSEYKTDLNNQDNRLLFYTTKILSEAYTLGCKPFFQIKI